MPAYSPTFDCDDSVLLMHDKFSSVGINTVAIIGDLKATGEKYEEIDHVWLLAEIGGFKIPFDWGTPCLDKQHYEGFYITHEQLLEQVRYDQLVQQVAANRSSDSQ